MTLLSSVSFYVKMTTESFIVAQQGRKKTSNQEVHSSSFAAVMIQDHSPRLTSGLTLRSFPTPNLIFHTNFIYKPLHTSSIIKPLIPSMLLSEGFICFRSTDQQTITYETCRVHKVSIFKREKKGKCCLAQSSLAYKTMRNDLVFHDLMISLRCLSENEEADGNVYVAEIFSNQLLMKGLTSKQTTSMKTLMFQRKFCNLVCELWLHSDLPQVYP